MCRAVANGSGSILRSITLIYLSDKSLPYYCLLDKIRSTFVCNWKQILFYPSLYTYLSQLDYSVIFFKCTSRSDYNFCCTASMLLKKSAWFQADFVLYSFSKRSFYCSDSLFSISNIFINALALRFFSSSI